MFDSATFHPRSLLHKQPWGAVPSGTAVTLSLRPLRRCGFSRGELHAFFEERDETSILPILWTGLDGDRDIFSVSLSTTDYIGLIWYSFHLTGADGRQETSQSFQLTVYDDSETVPTWFGEGMTYQIFPDRFCRLSLPNPSGMVGERSVHSCWEDDPVFLPDSKGEVRNRDFFGGSLAGVVSKLEFLSSLGVETIYFNPIFEAAENHRYGTGDYDIIDPMLGTNEDFSFLCHEAHRRGMRVMLDGVFNHVGYVSRYFNGTGEYGEGGAARDKNSPYSPWFSFHNWPDGYASWWGIYSLPAVNEENPDYIDFITGENGVVRRWLRAGADGWRLDVADELPDSFVHAIHTAVRAENPQAQIIGEVWEDGSNKVAYGKRRKHIWGGHCDGLMNYPFRNALIAWLLGGDAIHFVSEMETLRANYPPSAFYSAMNSLGTHDTPRILTLLGTSGVGADLSRAEKSVHRLTPSQRALGLSRLRLGFLILFTFPGSPTVYYGDEAGMEGWEDPFNRRTYPWGNEDTDLLNHVAALGALRKSHPALRRGNITYTTARGSLLVFTRSLADEALLIAVNNGADPASFSFPATSLQPLLGEGAVSPSRNNSCTVTLPPMTGGIWLAEHNQ